MTNPNTSPRAKRKIWPRALLAGLIVIPLAVLGIWAGIALNWSYSKGDRAGYVQKLSKKGWICKTWEGELAMANLPGTMPQIFAFSIRSDSIASLLQRSMGKRVDITYEEHRGVPTKCFGETPYYITDVRPAEP
jgi:hypothetical protein